jgi:predicted Zn-dependent protease
MRAHPSFRPLRLAAMLPALAACVSLVAPAPLFAQQVEPEINEQLPDMGTAAQSTLSLEDEYSLGRMVMRGLRESGRVIEDPELSEYLQSLGLRLSSQAHDGNRNFNFFVVKDPAINAFALPGGFIGVHAGLLMETDSESELAGVLAHEVAHIAQRHAADQITKQLAVNGLLGLLGALLGNAGGGARTAQIGAQILAGGYMLKFSRDDEREADRIGMRIMQSAGWDPRGMADFMDVLRREQGRDPGSVEVFLSSHPAPGERAALLRRAVGSQVKGRRDSGAFRSVKSRAQKLPPAKPMKRPR